MCLSFHGPSLPRSTGPPLILIYREESSRLSSSPLISLAFGPERYWYDMLYNVPNREVVISHFVIIGWSVRGETV